MNSYLDISLLSDAELPAPVLMNIAFTKLHKALCDLNSQHIGVSFPNCDLTPGNLLRIHGTASDLDQLQQLNWIGGMSGYCVVSEINSVPTETQFRTVSRKQTTMSHSKLKRLVKRGSIAEDEIKQYRAKMFTQGLDNPYLELTSSSNGHKHRRYIELGPLLDQPINGDFDHFGLSKNATIPWFP